MISSSDDAGGAFRLLCNLVETESVALLSELGCRAKPSGNCAPPQFAGGAVAALIGYAGETVRGSLTIVMSETAAALARAHTLSQGPGLEASRDFVGELSNLLLGRLKLRLIERDVTILLATPKTAAGGDLRVVGFCQDTSAWLAIDSEVGPMFVAFDAEFDRGFTMAEPDIARTPYHEGEMLLF
jgi:CheY-specific phosphatase CheX